MNVSSVSLRLRSLRSLCAVAATIATFWVAERAAAAGNIDVLSVGAPSPQAGGVSFTVTLRLQSSGGSSANVCATLFSGTSGGTIWVQNPDTRCAGTVADGQIATITWPATFTLFADANSGEVNFVASVNWADGSTAGAGDTITVIRTAAPAELAVVAVSPSKTTVFSGEAFTVDVPISNPAAAGSNSASVTQVTLTESSGGPNPSCGAPTTTESGPLAPQTVRTYRFTCQSAVSGAFQLRGAVTGSDASSGQALAPAPVLSNVITVSSPAAGLQVTSVAASPAAVLDGQTIAVDVFVRNTALVGGHDASAVSVAIMANPPTVGNASAGSCVQTSTADTSPLPPQVERRVSFNCVGSGAGTFSFQAGATGVDGPSPLTASGASAGVTVTDDQSPTVAIDPSPIPWSAIDLNFQLTATDNAHGSGVASVTVQIDGGPLMVTLGAQVSISLTTEAQHTISFFATDHAGNNSATTAATAGIDRTPPTITGSQQPPAVSGWNNTAVTVSFSCADALSQMQSCSGPVSLSAETAGTDVPGTALDQAGNTTAANFGPVKIDLTPPAVGAAVVEAANAAGWHAGPVTVRFTCTDALSGIATCPGDLVVSTEGTGQSASGTATDIAGNSASASAAGINIDHSVPTITGARAPAANAHGWNNGAVAVSFTCGDGLSGVASCAPENQTVGGEGAGQSVQGTATDVAGNSASAMVGNINIDLTPPGITASAMPAPNFLGWNNSAVTVQFACADALSGIDTCASDVVFAGEGMFAAAGSATDRAGNGAQGAMFAIKIDLTSPLVVAPSSPIVAEATSAAGAEVAFDVSADDAGSGVLPGSLGCMTGSGAVQSGAAFPLGTTNVTCAAMDLAGNVGTASFDITVRDTLPPALSTVNDIVAEATSAAGAIVTFDAPTATDAVAGALVATCQPGSGATFAIGTTAVTCSVSDGDGNSSTTTFNVAVQDLAPPIIGKVSGTNDQNQLIAHATTLQGAVVNYTPPTATDRQGTVPVSCTPPPGTRFAAGKTQVTCTATGSSGRIATATFTVWVKFQVAVDTRYGSAFRDPINFDGSSIFKLGNVVPVRFRLTGASAGIRTVAAYITVTKVSSTVLGTRREDNCGGRADGGDKFRYESGDKQYEFNLATRSLTQGTYQIEVELTDGNAQRISDGVVHTVRISLKR